MKIEKITVPITIPDYSTNTASGVAVRKLNELIDIINEQQERIEKLENKVEQIMPTVS